MGKNRKSIFAKIREAQKLFQAQEYTRAFNILSNVERMTTHLHLKSKIAHFKVQCLFQVGNIKSAIEYVESLLDFYPLSGQMNFLAATVYRRLDDRVKAGRLYLRCACLYPENTQYSLVYAQFLKESNRMEEAIGIIRKCLKTNKRHNKSPDSGIYFLYLELALVYHIMSHFERALILLNYCAQKNKDFPYYDLIADIYLKKNDFKTAKKYINLHMKLWGESDPEALFILSKVQVGLNKKDEAIQTLKKCCKIWGELVVTPVDMTYLFPLMQDGSLKKIPNLVLDL